MVGNESDWAPVFEEPGAEVPITVRLAIGCMLQGAKPIAAGWMLSWLVTHPDRQLRTPARRAFPELPRGGRAGRISVLLVECSPYGR